MQLTTSLKDKLKRQYGPAALVTGASSGIGLEMARLLAAAGLDLVINSRNVVQLQRIKMELESTYAVQVTVLQADLGNEQELDDFIKGIHHFNIGLCVLSAGFGTSGLFHRSNLANETAMLRVNCEAVLKLTHYFAGIFSTWKRGGIILLSSIVAFQGVPHAAHYAATKAWVHSLGEALSVELKPMGVDVLVAAPGPVKSGFESRAGMVIKNGMQPQQIALPILQALGHQSTVWPGSMSKLLIGALHTVPRFLKVQIMKTIMSGMTAQKT